MNKNYIWKFTEKIIASLEHKGTINSVLLEYWFQYQLLPILPKESVIIIGYVFK